MTIDNDFAAESLSSVGVCNYDNLLLIQDPGEADDTGREWRKAEVKNYLRSDGNRAARGGEPVVI